MDTMESYTPQVSVLGAILLQPELIYQAQAVLSSDDFQTANCRIVWQAMCSLTRNGSTVDVVLLRDALTGFPNAPAFLTSCMEAAPYAGNFQAHIEALKRQATLSKLRELGTSLSEASDLDEAMDILDKINSTSIRQSAKERRSISQMLQSFGLRHAATVTPDFIPWPLKPLNDGVRVVGGKFLVIGGYPSDGKTAFALQSALIQARKGRRAAFYSFETDANTVEDRALAHIAQINMDNIQRNALSSDDWSRFALASEYADAPFDVIAAAGMTVDDIRADALAHHYNVIYVDYLQLIDPGRSHGNYSRFDEVSAISRNLQRLAKTTGITVIALSQMSRPEADKKGKIPVPTMHNLRESGQIEQDADVIMLIYRTDHKDIRAPRYLDVAKNKEGRTGHFTLTFDGEHQSFSMASNRTPPAGMPRAARRDTRTEVLNDGADQMRIITDEDPEMPFRG